MTSDKCNNNITITDDIVEPNCFSRANKQKCWKEAMEEEMKAIREYDTWVLVPKEEFMNVIGSKWIYKVKRKHDGSVERCKARLVAQGYNQEGVNFQ